MQDPSFWGILATQFLGAFNDNLYKQLVLLSLLGEKKDDQAIAMAMFAAPFVVFSGIAGILSDRYPKRSVIRLAKFAEVCLMTLAAVAFYFHSLTALLAILFLMGIHSTYFGPAKYGILPEIFRSEDLPRANGWILMTTFLAIIFGMALAGWLLTLFPQQLWISGTVCIGFAILGTITTWPIRNPPSAQPDLKIGWSSLLIESKTWQAILADHSLLGVLMTSSLFWLVAGFIYPAAINQLGKGQFNLNDGQTGLLACSTGIGIAVGCVLAGRLSQNRVRGGLVQIGAWGLCGALTFLGIPGSQSGTLLGQSGSAVFLIAVGVFAGLFTVPLQVYLQYRAPHEHKGRLIGAFNLFNWIGILGAAAVYQVWVLLAGYLGCAQFHGFILAALIMLPIAILYRPPSTLITPTEITPPETAASASHQSQ